MAGEHTRYGGGNERLKWDRGSHGLTVAYFDIRKATAFVDSDNFFRAAGLQRNKGVEIESFGEIGKGAWGRSLLSAAANAPLPQVWDADALVA